MLTQLFFICLVSYFIEDSYAVKSKNVSAIYKVVQQEIKMYVRLFPEVFWALLRSFTL